MGRPHERRRGTAGGFTLVEVLLASSVLLITSLSLASAFSSAGLASRSSDRAVAVQGSFESVLTGLEDVPYHELLSWDGTTVARGDHRVEVSTRLVRVGLVLLEVVAVDDATDAPLARLATYRSEG